MFASGARQFGDNVDDGFFVASYNAVMCGTLGGQFLVKRATRPRLNLFSVSTKRLCDGATHSMIEGLLSSRFRVTDLNVGFVLVKHSLRPFQPQTRHPAEDP